MANPAQRPQGPNIQVDHWANMSQYCTQKCSQLKGWVVEHPGKASFAVPFAAFAWWAPMTTLSFVSATAGFWAGRFSAGASLKPDAIVNDVREKLLPATTDANPAEVAKAIIEEVQTHENFQDPKLQIAALKQAMQTHGQEPAARAELKTALAELEEQLPTIETVEDAEFYIEQLNQRPFKDQWKICEGYIKTSHVKKEVKALFKAHQKFAEAFLEGSQDDEKTSRT